VYVKCEAIGASPRIRLATDARAGVGNVAIGVAVVRAFENDAPHCHLLLRKRDQVMSRKIVFHDRLPACVLAWLTRGEDRPAFQGQ
jgi:hypothetical protein